MNALKRLWFVVKYHFANVDHYLAQQRGDYRASRVARGDMDRCEIELWKLRYDH